jgi:hypothetical protein
MPLQSPKLDQRTFADLVEEAKNRIPRYTPEWTNFNDSDPGMTLVKLHAWLTETLLWQMNRLPDLNYIKFLQLLDVQPRPALPAHAELTFTLKKLSAPTDPLVKLIAKHTQVGVNDPDVDEDIIFETDRDLRAINAGIGAMVKVTGDPFELLSEYDADEKTLATPPAYHPFGETLAVGDAWVIGIVLRPHRMDDENYSLDRFPQGNLDLTIATPDPYDTDEQGNLLLDYQIEECIFPHKLQAAARPITWEVFTGTANTFTWDGTQDWQRLTAIDTTAALSKNGHITLDMPGGLPTVALSELSEERWDDINFQKIDPLNPPDPLPPQPAVPAYGMVWIRARVTSVDPDQKVPFIKHTLLNTVPATAAVTRVDEIIGQSTGLPNQTFTLRRQPILIDAETGLPDIDLTVIETDENPWTIVTSFYGGGADADIMRFDAADSTLMTGDGRHGRIPVAGSDVIARRYRYGGGAIGNVGAGTITALRTALSDVDSVTNVLAAFGGADEEPLDEVMLRAPHDLRTRDRAVTADDFAFLATQTPDVPIQRAFALAPTAPVTNETGEIVYEERAGAVTVVILPETKQDKPQPSQDQIQRVCAYLNHRRLITTQLYVVGVQYVDIERLSATLLVDQHYSLQTVYDAAMAQLLAYFHPLSGGDHDQLPGWEFGGNVYFANVYRQLLNVEGVLRVQCLEISPDNSDAVCDGIHDDMITIPAGKLVYLSRDVVSLRVEYER